MASHPNRKPARPSPSPALIAELRAQSLLSQPRFGELVHARLRIVQAWEAGDRRMPPGVMELLCIALVAHRFHSPGRWMLEWVRPEICALWSVR